MKISEIQDLEELSSKIDKLNVILDDYFNKPLLPKVEYRKQKSEPECLYFAAYSLLMQYKKQYERVQFTQAYSVVEDILNETKD